MFLFSARRRRSAATGGHANAPSPEDVALATRLRDGEADAFDTVFRAQYPAVVRYLLRFPWLSDAADDVAQDTFVRLWERCAEIDPNRSLRAYVLTIARNLALDRARHYTTVQSHVDRVLADGSGAEVSSDPGPEQLLIAAELDALIAKQAAQLSPRLREIYYLSRVEELTPAEIAKTLGIAASTVYVQYAKILRALYPAFERWMRE